jgi:hypothetical protein
MEWWSWNMYGPQLQVKNIEYIKKLLCIDSPNKLINGSDMFVQMTGNYLQKYIAT